MSLPMDCSDVNKQWVLLYCENSEPGLHFQTVKWDQVISNGRRMTEDANVLFLDGEKERKAIVVKITDYKHEIKDNFDEITSNFLKRFNAKATTRRRMNVSGSKRQLKDECDRFENDETSPKCNKMCYDNVDLQESTYLLTEILDGFAQSNVINVVVPNDITVKEEYRDGMRVVIFGQHKTAVEYSIYKRINWDDVSGSTRTLLTAVFTNEVLATHCLTGRSSNAFRGTDKVAKPKLNSHKVEDIVDIVSKKCQVSAKRIRNYVTAKCADENKMRIKRNQKMKLSNQEMDKLNKITVDGKDVQEDKVQENEVQDEVLAKVQDVVQGEVQDNVQSEVADKIEFANSETSDVQQTNKDSQNNLSMAYTAEQIENTSSFEKPTTPAGEQAITNMGRICYENKKIVIQIGPNNTTIDYELFRNIEWKNVHDSTKSLVCGIYLYKLNNNVSEKLSAENVADTIEFITIIFPVTKEEVKNSIVALEGSIWKNGVLKINELGEIIFNSM